MVKFLLNKRVVNAGTLLAGFDCLVEQADDPAYLPQLRMAAKLSYPLPY